MQDSDKRVQTEPLPERLLTPNGMGPPPFVEHQHTQDGSSLSDDVFEFIMHHLECCALQYLRGDHAPSIETLRGMMESEFPQRVCAFVHECTSARARLSRIPCICTQLTVVYPHWMRRRLSRNGRSLFPQLFVPKDITQDGEDPYLVFRDTNETWKRDQAPTTSDGRSRNPRRDQLRKRRLEQEEERRRNMPKRVKLTLPTPPPPPPRPPTPTPAPSVSNTAYTSASNTAYTPTSNTAVTPAPNPPTPPPNTAVNTPPTPSRPSPSPPPPHMRVPANGTVTSWMAAVPVVEDGTARLFKDQSQTPVDVSPPPCKAAAFFSVADARSAAETVIFHEAPEPMDVEPMEVSMSPLTEPPAYDPSDPDA
ncbi:hypothetical protein AURDEDRAFT_111522 [Auricularia subglabra TFB-10046 SS5]|nr:hypothetical protein AURDEDRAFT_111522 [Auricularia subglabra TFB-10046 SS5]